MPCARPVHPPPPGFPIVASLPQRCPGRSRVPAPATECHLSPLQVFYGCMLVGLVATTVALRRTHRVHLHHYFTAALMVPLTRFRGPVPAIWQALLVGFHLQGVAVFGMEPLFYRRTRYELGLAALQRSS